jgi:hypothetical protein
MSEDHAELENRGSQRAVVAGVIANSVGGQQREQTRSPATAAAGMHYLGSRFIDDVKPSFANPSLIVYLFTVQKKRFIPCTDNFSGSSRNKECGTGCPLHGQSPIVET